MNLQIALKKSLSHIKLKLKHDAGCAYVKSSLISSFSAASMYGVPSGVFPFLDAPWNKKIQLGGQTSKELSAEGWNPSKYKNFWSEAFGIIENFGHFWDGKKTIELTTLISKLLLAFLCQSLRVLFLRSVFIRSVYLSVCHKPFISVRMMPSDQNFIFS